MPKTGFIFDMDGCLLNSIGAWHDAERYICEIAGIELSKEQRDELNTLTLEEVGDFFHDRFGAMASSEDVIQAILDYMLNFYRSGVEAVPGALDFVRAAYDAECPLCVLSSSPLSFLHAGLERAGFDCFVPDDLILSAEELGMVKREVSTFGRVCDMLGTEPSSTWLLDDSWYALATAREAGLHCIGVFSNDNCGTHEELGRYSDKVVNDFTTLNLEELLFS